jgi:Bacterial Ig-like domain
MNMHHDPELDDVLQDDELRHIAAALRSARRPEPPLDDAFRTALRRQVMTQAWAISEGRHPWWRRVFAPVTFAWAGAAAGLLLIASLVLFNALQPSGGLDQIVIHGNVDGSRNVALQQPILVSFNQPMDHPSTEAAVRIAPATTVTFAWNENTLAVQPTGGDLAPNTQYQVTIGPGAKTASGKKLSSPQTIRFVTQPPPSPAPSPTARPTPQNPVAARQLAALGGAGSPAVQWSADSSSVYFVDGKGALEMVPAAGGTPTVLAPDGVSSPAMSPAGDRLAYIRGGKIEILTLDGGKTEELSVTPAPLVAGWSGDAPIWAAEDGFYTLGADGASRQVAALPAGVAAAEVSISPDGGHAAYAQDGKLFLIDLSTGDSVQVGDAGAAFAAWSPVGPELLYTSGGRLVVSDFAGGTEQTLPGGDAAWSSADAILVGGDTSLVELRPDGSNQTTLADGSFHAPRWAPDSASFTFVRGGALWIGTAPSLPAEVTAVGEASTVVKSFMDARLAGQSDVAAQYLDASGRQAYGTGGISLIPTGGGTFSRYYTLTQEQTGGNPDTVRAVVRLVLSRSNVDVAAFEETLILVRDTTSGRFLIDQATAAPQRNLGNGPEVVSVAVDANTVTVTFDSDLNPSTVTAGVHLVDAAGNPVKASISYANRVVTLDGVKLKPDAQYTLVVATSVQDVNGQAVSAEYDLAVVGPAGRTHGKHRTDQQDSPTPAASASPG